MRVTLGAALAVGLLAAPDQGVEDLARTEKARLQGAWALASWITEDGRRVPPAPRAIGRTGMPFRGGTVRTDYHDTDPEDYVEEAWEADPGRSPRAITFTALDS